jgi:hypothetical protein
MAIDAIVLNMACEPLQAMVPLNGAMTPRADRLSLPATGAA